MEKYTIARVKEDYVKDGYHTALVEPVSTTHYGLFNTKDAAVEAATALGWLPNAPHQYGPRTYTVIAEVVPDFKAALPLPTLPATDQEGGN